MTGVVHVRDPRVRWSLRASEVLRIAPAAAEWHAVTVDMLSLIGAPAVARTASQRVVIVRGGKGRDLALLAPGPIEVTEVDASDVLPLPAALARSPEISAIIVCRDGSLSLLLEPSAVTIAQDTVPDEELCPSRS
jgi:chemotaxis signal transduction protein